MNSKVQFTDPKDSCIAEPLSLHFDGKFCDLKYSLSQNSGKCLIKSNQDKFLSLRQFFCAAAVVAVVELKRRCVSASLNTANEIGYAKSEAIHLAFVLIPEIG